MKLYLKNTLTLVEYTLSVYVENSDTLYYTFDVDLSDVNEGEYNYTLLDDDNNVLATGIMRVGDYKQPTPTTYNKKNNYITYGSKK